MIKRRVMSLLISGLLSGCAPTGMPSPQPPAAPASQGKVTLNVQWPSSRQLQLLPLSTQELTIDLSSLEGVPLAHTSLERVPGQATSAATLAVSAGQVLVTVKGYARDPGGGRSLVAQAAQELTIRPNVDTPCAMAMVPVDTPYLIAQGGLHAPPGSTLVLEGGNFGAARQTSFDVLIGGASVPSPVRLSDGRIRITVPEAATSGDIQVVSDGVPSVPVAFQLLSRLTLHAPATAQRQSVVPIGLSGHDERGEEIAEPQVRWFVQSASKDYSAPLATIAQDGLLTVGDATGTVLVFVKSGPVAATASIQVQ